MIMSKTVCIQGLGFVGAAMAAAISEASIENDLMYLIIGIDLDTNEGNRRIEKLNEGLFPFETNDGSLISVLKNANLAGILKATNDKSVIEEADIVISSVNLDLIHVDGVASVNFQGYEKTITDVATRIRPDALFLIESTIPPGTISRIVKPLFEDQFKKRGISSSPLIAHSYERVMPGPNYLNSIRNFWRVYSGVDEAASLAAEYFLSSIINVREYPLRRLQSTEQSEIAKVLENSYRSVNIAFINEWRTFSEELGIDLFEIIKVIKDRPTHNNIMSPGFGVGGYCLTKDPLFAKIAAKEIYDLDVKFPFSELSVMVNKTMPISIVNKIIQRNSSNKGFKLLILGISYKEGVGDTRYSPAEIAYKELIQYTERIDLQDDYVVFWEEIQLPVDTRINDLNTYDVLLFTLRNASYQSLNFTGLNNTIEVYDANNVLSDEQLLFLKQNGNFVYKTGRGEIK